MSFLDLIKDVVVSDTLFPFLHHNDLLRLRRVCKFTKSLADDYIRLYSKSDQYIPVQLPDVGNKSGPKNTNLSVLLNLEDLIAGSTRCHIQNTPTWNTYITNGDLSKFVQKYGNQITHLKVDHLSIPMTCPEIISFFESLPNLTHLTVSKLHDGQHGQGVSKKKLVIPATFKNLKSFNIGTYYPADTNGLSEQTSMKMWWNFFNKCSNKLEYVQHPFIQSKLKCFNRGGRSDPGEPFESIIKLIKRRSNLKYVDLIGYEEDGMMSSTPAFHKLLTVCFRNNIKILNVDATLIQEMIYEDEEMPNAREFIDGTIVSVKNMTYKAFRLELPLLEKIWIDSTTNEAGMVFEDRQYACETFQQPGWSNLKELKLIIGEMYLIGTGEQNGIFSQQAINYFFVGIKRENLETLNLTFAEDELSEEEYMGFPIPKPKDIVRSCGNLKNLSLTNWQGTNKMLVQLWEGLPLLEKVELGSCQNLGNVAFVGENVQQPVFLNLKRLKHLALKGLAESPKITDTLFTLVLRHMPLKSLYLSSQSDNHDDKEEGNKSIKSYPSITVAGIEALHSGEFANTIEKLMLVKLKLKYVTGKKMRKLQSQFRSAKML